MRLRLLFRPLAFLLAAVGAVLHDAGVTLGVPAIGELRHIRQYAFLPLRTRLHILLVLPVCLPLAVIGIVLIAFAAFCHLGADVIDWRWEERWPALAIVATGPDRDR